MARKRKYERGSATVWGPPASFGAQLAVIDTRVAAFGARFAILGDKYAVSRRPIRANAFPSGLSGGGFQSPTNATRIAAIPLFYSQFRGRKLDSSHEAT